MTDYDIFAQFYDRAMAIGSDTEEKTVLLRRWIKQYRPGAKTLLELACGTGTILREMAPDFQVSGLDRSPEMLKIAANKVPGAELHLGDMAAFELGQNFDVILCVFDSVNHLSEFSEWQSMFARTASHLRPHGLFIFDINTVGRLQRLTALPAWVAQLAGGRIEMEVTPGDKFLTNWNVKYFERGPNGEERVLEENIGETSFALERVRKALQAHFAVLNMATPLGAEPNDDSDRVYFVCRLL